VAALVVLDISRVRGLGLGLAAELVYWGKALMVLVELTVAVAVAVAEAQMEGIRPRALPVPVVLLVALRDSTPVSVRAQSVHLQSA
jgi:hypothetical protein